MASNNGKVIGRLVKELDALPLNGVFEKEKVLTCYMFLVYLVNLLGPLGIHYRGHSLRERAALDLLVVKVTIEGEGKVCFVSGRTPISCMAVFLRRLEEDTVEWRPDRYA